MPVASPEVAAAVAEPAPAASYAAVAAAEPVAALAAAAPVPAAERAPTPEPPVVVVIGADAVETEAPAKVEADEKIEM